MYKFLRHCLRAVAISAAGLVMAAPATAADPSGVNSTIEGCRNNGSILLPDSGGKFICPDAAYTTGNLGKGWSELDLVPYRITMSAGNSAPATQTYSVSAMLDGIDGGVPGYDVLSAPVLNSAKSSGTCSAAVVGSDHLETPGLGGTDSSRARLLTITQAKNTTCVYDFYGRLAIGASKFSGSSLHANLANENFSTAGVGAADVSIPVKEIAPQGLSKDMSASVASDVTWGLTKTATPSRVSFGDMCAADTPKAQPVKIRVEWVRKAATAGKVSITTHVYADNPASRTIAVQVVDKIYTGPTATPDVLLDTATSAVVNVPARDNALVLTHTFEVDAATAGGVGSFLSDVATATYTDVASGVAVPGQTTAKAQTQIQAGAVNGSTVNIADLETIDATNPANTGLTFAVAAPSVGSFIGYTAGTAANKVEWGYTGVTASGGVDFDKTLSLDTKRIVNGGLMIDTASLVATDGSFKTSAGPIEVQVSSTASVQLKLSKSIPAGLLAAGESIVVEFVITGPNGYKVERSFTFKGGEGASQSLTLTSLEPGVYIAEEKSALFFAAGSSVGVDSKLVPTGGASRTVNLDVSGGDFAKCTGEASFANAIPNDQLPTAQVQKTTQPALAAGDPDLFWTFTLRNSAGAALVTATAEAGKGNVVFIASDGNPYRLGEGSYSITETSKSPAWVQKEPSSTSCTFTVNLPQDVGKVFGCSFVNEKQGKAQVEKTVAGQALTGTQSYTFQLRSGASLTALGTVLETGTATGANGGKVSFTNWLTPGASYQLCETLLPGWKSSLSAAFVPGGSLTDPDNSVLCTSFSVTAGEVKVFKIDNTPPPGGRAHTIGYWKNWASCKTSGGKQEPVLDRTLFGMLPGGLQVGVVKSVVVTDANGLFVNGLYGQNANTTADCQHAVSLLGKRDFGDRVRASNPLFNMAAQLVAAELNIGAGAFTCTAVNTTISSAHALLVKWGFDGVVVPTVKGADANTANGYATLLDNYNNNKPGVCP